MTSGNRITNIDIEKLKYWNKWWFKKNFVGVYSSDSIIKYINFDDIIKEERGKYRFAIFNTDKENKPGTHWWSFLDIYPKKRLIIIQ